MQEIRKLVDARVANFTGDAIEMQEPRFSALSGRLLRNQLGWQIEFVFSDVHTKMVVRPETTASG
jgi:hypothetical protein